jgi:hypothetical protein
MDAYFGFTKQGTISEQEGLDQNIGKDVLGIPGTNGTRKFEAGWPEFDFNGGSDYATAGNNTNFMPYYRHDPQYQYVVNFNWTRGPHNIRFGADIYRQGLNQTQAEWIGGGSFYGSQGGFDFGRNTTSLCKDPPVCSSSTSTNRANSYASFLLGLADQGSKSLQFPDEYHIRSMLYSAYIRDRWNVTPHLTVNYGVRWEYFPYPTRSDRGLERYDPTTNKVLICGAGSVPGNCGAEISKKRFSPRVGIAWRATNSFVIRAGYGMTNDPYEAMELMRNNYPIMEPFGLQTVNKFTPATTLARGIPSLPPAPSLGNGVIDLPLNIGFAGQPQNLHRGYIQSWNLTLQKELSWGFTAQAGYVATRSTRQLGFVDINAAQIPFTNLNSEPLYQKWGRTAATTFLEPLGTGHYDSLQASLQRRFSKGFMMNVNYTFGKAIGLVDASSGTPNIQSLSFLRMNRAPTGYDRTHNIAITNIWDLPLGRGQKWASSKGPVTALDFGLFRDFRVTERVHAQFRAEAFNFTNTPHFANPDSSIGDANAVDPRTGRVTDPGPFMTLNNGVVDLAREGIDERQFRFGLRIQF